MTDFSQLAVYDAERARGLVHAPEWDAEMAALRREFRARLDARVRAMLDDPRRRSRDGGTLIAMTDVPRGLWAEFLDALDRVRRERAGR